MLALFWPAIIISKPFLLEGHSVELKKILVKHFLDSSEIIIHKLLTQYRKIRRKWNIIKLWHRLEELKKIMDLKTSKLFSPFDECNDRVTIMLLWQYSGYLTFPLSPGICIWYNQWSLVIKTIQNKRHMNN